MLSASSLKSHLHTLPSPPIWDDVTEPKALIAAAPSPTLATPKFSDDHLSLSYDAPLLPARSSRTQVWRISRAELNFFYNATLAFSRYCHASISVDALHFPGHATDISKYMKPRKKRSFIWFVCFAKTNTYGMNLKQKLNECCSCFHCIHIASVRFVCVQTWEHASMCVTASVCAIVCL